jgi:hypothetical protein
VHRHLHDQTQQKVQVEQFSVISFWSTMATKFLQIWSCLCRGLKTENPVDWRVGFMFVPIECRAWQIESKLNVQEYGFNSPLCFDGTAIGLVMRTETRRRSVPLPRWRPTRNSKSLRCRSNWSSSSATVAVTMAAPCLSMHPESQRGRQYQAFHQWLPLIIIVG